MRMASRHRLYLNMACRDLMYRIKASSLAAKKRKRGINISVSEIGRGAERRRRLRDKSMANSYHHIKRIRVYKQREMALRTASKEYQRMWRHQSCVANIWRLA